MKNGALYIRVSTHMQDELSPDAQKRLLLDYALNNDIIVSEEYIFEEKGISGKRADKRPQFQQMIALAKSKPSPFEVILVWKFSRFARNQEESIVYKSLLRKQNVEVISVSEPVADGPFGSLIERIIEWMDEYYSIRLSGEVMRGMTEKALRGGYQANPPLGYRIQTPKTPPVIVREEAPIIQYIYDAYANQRRGIFDIARSLNEKGYKTRQNKAFERRSVEYILQNPVYCGWVRWNRCLNETQEIKDPSEWIIRKGEHEAIITEELYNKAKERFETEYKPKKTRPSSSYKHWLSGIVKCPACGRTMIAKGVKSSDKVLFYFTCYGYSKGKCLAKTSISGAKLEPVVLAAIKEAFETETDTYRIIAAKPASLKENIDAKRLSDLIGRISIKEQRARDAYMSGIDTLEEYKKIKTTLSNERNKLEEQLQLLSAPSPISKKEAQKPMLMRIKNVYDILSSDADIATKNDMIKSIIEKIIYDKETDTIKLFYYFTP